MSLPMKGDDMNEKPGHKESQKGSEPSLAHNLKLRKSLNRLEPLNTTERNGDANFTKQIEVQLQQSFAEPTVHKLLCHDHLSNVIHQNHLQSRTHPSVLQHHQQLLAIPPEKSQSAHPVSPHNLPRRNLAKCHEHVFLFIAGGLLRDPPLSFSCKINTTQTCLHPRVQM